MKRILFVFLFLLGATEATAQQGTCEMSMAGKYLDAGNVRAYIPNDGRLFRGHAGEYYEPGINFEAPKGIGANSIYAASLWVGGNIDDEFRAAGTRYGWAEFWAGPLDEAGNPPADCKPFDHIWEIRTADIDSFYTDGHISQNLQNWPWQLGAPVVDGDGDPTNYNLAGGDLPELLGDQRLWWIMNDRGNQHESTVSEPIGIEVHASAFAFNNPGPLGNFTFYEYEIINKNSKPLTDAYVSMFADVDLGDFSDDYVGSDSLLQYGYAYNSDNLDDGCGVGIIPPAVGFTFLPTIAGDADGIDNNFDGIVDEEGEMVGISSVLYNVEPYMIDRYKNVMEGRLEYGDTMYKGGRGYESWGFPSNLPLTPTRFAYSGDPVTGTFWSEFNVDDLGTPNDPYDRNLVTTMGQFDIASGEKKTIRLAIVWSQGTDHLHSVRLLKKDVTGVRNTGDALFTANLPERPQKRNAPINGFVLGFDQNFPNPFTESTTIRYSLPQDMQVRLTVFDMLGREVQTLVEQRQAAGTYNINFEAGNLPAGMYLARIELDYLQFTKRMTLMR
ncbi:MAG: T9SS type A sorting domain-containing protein [Bacteroidota bacterium]